MTIEYNISSTVAPIPKTSLFNTSLPAAESNWLSIEIIPTNTPSYIRIYVCVSVSGIFRVVRIISGTTITENMNGGNALSASAGYMFTVEYRSGDSINLRYSVTSGTIYILRIDEIAGAE